MARVALMLGPGHHGEHLAQALREEGVLARVVRPWPDFAVEDCAGGRVRRAPLFALGVRLLQAAGHRLPGLGPERLRLPRYLLADLLARRHLGGCDLFVGWSQLCLRSLRRARELGVATLLEHPMAHVDVWAQAVAAEGAAFTRFPPALLRRARAEYEAADGIVVLSAYARESFLRAGVPPGRVIQVAPGVDAGRFVPRPRPLGAVPRVLFAGRLDRLKGVGYLLAAFARLRCPAELWLAGPVLPEIAPDLRRHADARVRVLGPLPPAEMPACYQQADVLVLPSLTEGFGLVLLEAMACGLPVLATPCSGAPEVVREGGWLVPPRDVAALSERLEALLAPGQEERRREMGARARDAVLAGYTLGHYRARIAAAYAPALGRTPRTPHVDIPAPP